MHIANDYLVIQFYWVFLSYIDLTNLTYFQQLREKDFFSKFDFKISMSRKKIRSFEFFGVK